MECERPCSHPHHQITIFLPVQVVMPGLLVHPMALTMTPSSSSPSKTPLPVASQAADPVVTRTTSFAGQKRSLQVEGLNIIPPRRTKSTGDAKMSKVADDGYKRGIIRTFVRNALEQVPKVGRPRQSHDQIRLLLIQSHFFRETTVHIKNSSLTSCRPRPRHFPISPPFSHFSKPSHPPFLFSPPSTRLS